MSHGTIYLKGFELTGAIIEMLGGNNKTALTKEGALQMISLLPTLKTYLPEEGNISLYLERILQACRTIQEFDQVVLEDSTKEILVRAFRLLKEGLATFLFNYFDTDEKVDVTPQTIPLLREIVSLAYLGEEI